jgi:hypothetical protein
MSIVAMSGAAVALPVPITVIVRWSSFPDWAAASEAVKMAAANTAAGSKVRRIEALLVMVVMPAVALNRVGYISNLAFAIDDEAKGVIVTSTIVDILTQLGFAEFHQF